MGHVRIAQLMSFQDLSLWMTMLFTVRPEAVMPDALLAVRRVSDSSNVNVGRHRREMLIVSQRCCYDVFV